MSATGELIEPFEPVTEAAASALLNSRYGIPDPVVARLETERDDTFHVASAAGEFVLKISNPADDPLVINLQTAAMAFAAEIDDRLPLQRVLPTLDGDIEAEGPDGRIMRVLTWLPGELLRHAPRSAESLAAFGEMQGRLALALEDFRHPAASRELAWDVERLPALRPLLEFAPDVAHVVDRFETLGGRIAALPHQVVHNDLNLDNVLIGDGGVTGILDFGDVVHTARAVDLAVSLSYLLNGGWASVETIIDGYRRVNPLISEELELLPELVAGRLAMRIILGEWLAHAKPENAEYARRNLSLSREQLASLES